MDPPVENRSFIDLSVALMLADPTDEGRWVHDGEKFVDGTYRIACTSCGRVAFELELLAIALVPVAVHYGGGGGPPKPAPLAELGEPSYHVVAYACDGCDRAVVAEGCPLCGATGPLRERP